MLLTASALKGYAIEASDGKIGTVSDLLFDDENWRVRWLVVDAGTWLIERKLLVHPSAIGSMAGAGQVLPVNLTRAQVAASPDIRRDQPVSRQMETHLYDYYGWDPYWGGGSIGLGGIASPLAVPPCLGVAAVDDSPGADGGRAAGDPHLQSIDAVCGYHIHATDGEIGHVADFLLDDAGWGIRYLIIDTGNWWPGEKVLISPQSVKDIDWADRLIHLDVTRHKVKGRPTYDPSITMDGVYDEKFLSYYGIKWVAVSAAPKV